jgi:hypothetical protein
VYVKQSKIPDAHREVEWQVSGWLKQGVIQLVRSKFNSLLYAISNLEGGIRLVQDFWALSTKTWPNNHSLQEVNKSIEEIGWDRSTVFSKIDLTTRF